MIGLRWWRRARGLTQRELAARSGVQQRTISRLESGLVEEPRTRTLLKLSEALGVEPFDLLFGEHSVGLFGPPEGLVRRADRNFPSSSPVLLRSSSTEEPQEHREDITLSPQGVGPMEG